MCVGLDPDPVRMAAAKAPEHMGNAGAPQDLVATYLREVLAGTAPHAAAFKFQFAHFAALAAETLLARLIKEAHERFPSIPVILDAKRGDIGSTADHYAVEAFERYEADAVTVNPYLGWEAIAPFQRYSDRGIFVLARTSNPGSDWLQRYPEQDPAYLRVAALAAEKNSTGNIGLVAGATYPQDLEAIRQVAPDVTLLVPGIGAQGGDLSAVMKAHGRSDATGLLINSSRGIVFAPREDGEDIAAAAGRAARSLRDSIRNHSEKWAQMGQ